MIKAVISHGETSHQVELEGSRENELIGKKIGDTVDGDAVGLQGYELEVRGGSDDDGFPMRRDLEGTGRDRLLVSGGEGFTPENDGERRKRSVHGNTVDRTIAQVNLTVTEAGEEELAELLTEG